MIRRFVVKIVVCALALWAADFLLPGFTVNGGFIGYAVAGALLGVLNTFIRPLLKLLTLPLILITLGLFSFIINAAILWFVARSLETIAIANLSSLMAATFIIAIVTMLFEPSTDE